MNFISKDSFLLAFKEAHKAAITEVNIKSAFRSAGLVPFDPGRVLAGLDMALRTTSPPSSPRRMWTSRTPQNPKELELQSTLDKEKICVHQNGSPMPINDALDKIESCTEKIVHYAALVKELQNASDEVKARQNRRVAKFLKTSAPSFNPNEVRNVVNQNATEVS
jgi:hypothetical protein